MGFYLKREIDLSEYGWDGCKVEFIDLSYEEMLTLQQKITNSNKGDKSLESELIGFLKEKFLVGEGLDENNQKLPITKENLVELPNKIVVGIAYKLASGDINPK